jgi:FkbM family methyltransferase
MQNLVTESFSGPKGLNAVFSFRPNTADRNTILATYKEDEYDFKSMVPLDGDAMIDAGGYVGSTAILYAQLYPMARIFCVEPLPENLEIIRKNISQNKLWDRITLVEKALWSVSQKVIPIYYRDQSDVGAVHKFVGSAFPSYHETVSKDFASVETISLPDLIHAYKLGNIRVLKIDTEGAEYETLAGAPLDYLKRIQTIVGEYHNINPGKETVPRTALYSLVAHNFDNVSKGEEVPTWGSFLFERKI